MPEAPDWLLWTGRQPTSPGDAGTTPMDSEVDVERLAANTGPERIRIQSDEFVSGTEISVAGQDLAKDASPVKEVCDAEIVDPWLR